MDKTVITEPAPCPPVDPTAPLPDNGKEPVTLPGPDPIEDPTPPPTESA